MEGLELKPLFEAIAAGPQGLEALEALEGRKEGRNRPRAFAASHTLPQHLGRLSASVIDPLRRRFQGGWSIRLQ